MVILVFFHIETATPVISALLAVLFIVRDSARDTQMGISVAVLAALL